MTPSELLVAAADRIRDLAAKASPGVWAAKNLTEHGHPGAWWVEVRHEDDETTSWSTVADLSNINSGADARWIAALSPAVAPALIGWLQESSGKWAIAEQRAPLAGTDCSQLVRDDDRAALDFARLLCPDLVEEQQ
jgi:hypothetical protein